MNILLTKLPQSIKIDSQEYTVKTDFRAWIEFEIEFQKTSNLERKLDLIFNMFKIRPVVKNADEFNCLIEEIIKFYNCGEKINNEKGNENNSSGPLIYSFKNDHFHIYTDFLRFYSIDLNEVEYLHWWKFRQMFIELPEDSKIKTIMMYRSIKITSKMSPEHRQFYAKMKRIYALEDSRTAKDKTRSFGSLLASHMKITDKVR